MSQPSLHRVSPPDKLELAQLRVLLAHRSAIVREGTRRILEMEPGFEVVADAGHLTTATPLVQLLKPDVVVLGVDPAEMESEAYQRQIRNLGQITHILMLDFDAPPARLASLGITGWLPATASPGELINAIRAVADGRAPAVNQAIADPTPLEGPTPREREVLRLVAQGLATLAVADRLQITTRTVHFHVSNLLAKLGARSRTEMVHLARKRGWLD